MTYQIYTTHVASITDLKKNPMATVESAHGQPLAILNRNQPAFYCIPGDVYVAMLESLEDLEIQNILRDRLSEKEIPVNINDL